MYIYIFCYSLYSDACFPLVSHGEHVIITALHKRGGPTSLCWRIMSGAHGTTAIHKSVPLETSAAAPHLDPARTGSVHREIKALATGRTDGRTDGRAGGWAGGDPPPPPPREQIQECFHQPYF